MAEKLYSSQHEWIEISGQTARIGISHYAQDQLGDIVFVELPEIGRKVAAGGEAAIVESVKAASEVYAPLAGEVIAVNQAIADDPALVNRDAEGEGWFMEISLANAELPQNLMKADAYQAFIAQQDS